MLLKDTDSLFANDFLQTEEWYRSCTQTESTLHQLSPYIGKLKSSIARNLIEAFSKPGDWVLDPFSGSGTIPLEATLLGRKAFAADISPYSRVLTMAKLNAPPHLESAINRAEELLAMAKIQPEPHLQEIPVWVRDFFHPETLAEAMRFAAVCRTVGNEFWLACFLGILHHERPGFLSYPSSHLVPYLRNKKYPHQLFPEMYRYKELRPRLLAKIRRIYKRFSGFPLSHEWRFIKTEIDALVFPEVFDCLITSPPYMNALDYVRDNRLRLWFIEPDSNNQGDNPVIREKKAFQQAIALLGEQTNLHLKRGGFCILVVGEKLVGQKNNELSKDICRIIAETAPHLVLLSTVKDNIPDIRRARKNCKATKTEHILIFRKV